MKLVIRFLGFCIIIVAILMSLKLAVYVSTDLNTKKHSLVRMGKATTFSKKDISIPSSDLKTDKKHHQKPIKKEHVEGPKGPSLKSKPKREKNVNHKVKEDVQRKIKQEKTPKVLAQTKTLAKERPKQEVRLQDESSTRLKVVKSKPSITSNLLDIPTAKKPDTKSASRSPKKSSSIKREITTIKVPDPLFLELDAQQASNSLEITDSQRSEFKKGAYSWGVLEDYADPDQAIEFVGGVLVAKNKWNGAIYRLMKRGDEVVARPVVDPSAVYGRVGLSAHGHAAKLLLENAINRAVLSGEITDFELYYLFPLKVAAYIEKKVVTAFECVAKNIDVIAITRPNGGTMGVLVPNYFIYNSQKIPYPQRCLAQDREYAAIKPQLSKGVSHE